MCKIVVAKPLGCFSSPKAKLLNWVFGELVLHKSGQKLIYFINSKDLAKLYNILKSDFFVMFRPLQSRHVNCI